MRHHRRLPEHRSPDSCGAMVLRCASAGLLALALIGRFAQSQSPASDSAAVRTVAEGIIAADNARDIAAVLDFYSASAVLMPPGEEPVVGQAAIRPRYEALFAAWIPDIESRIDEIVVAGGWAFVRGHNGGILRSVGGSGDRRLNDSYLMLLRREGGTWKISRLIWHASGPPLPSLSHPEQPATRSF